LLVHDAHINSDKTGPLHVAEYSALLMNITEGRCYSISEIRRWMADAGFTELRTAALPPPMPHRVVSGVKP